MKAIVTLTMVFVIGAAQTATAMTIVQNQNLSVTATVPSATFNNGSGGGVPLLNIFTPQEQVQFSGFAYPNQIVRLLKDGQFAGQYLADNSAEFSALVSNVSDGFYTFTFHTTDPEGEASLAQTFYTEVRQGLVTSIGKIFIPPSMSITSGVANPGDSIELFGYSVPGSTVELNISGPEASATQVFVGDDGRWRYVFPTSTAASGTYGIKARSLYQGFISNYSELSVLSLGTGDLSFELPTVEIDQRPGDVNGDGRVDLIDFSIMAFWHERPLDESMRQLDLNVLNGDGQIDLADFSIMAFYWTG